MPGQIPEEFLDELTSRLDILDVVGRYVQMKKRGGNYFGLCPFHHEKTPSFSVNQDKQIYHCFGCGAGGGVINFIMRVEQLEFVDAVTMLAQMAGIAMPENEQDSARRKRREALWELNTEAARYFRDMLHSPAGSPARDYFEQRKLSSSTIAKFGLGFAPDGWQGLIDAMSRKGFDRTMLAELGLAVAGKNGHYYDRFRNRVMFPIIDVRGKVIGFGGRVMDKSEPKYLNSPESPLFSKGSNLFALNFAKKDTNRTLILAEGYMDVISLHQAGFPIAVASLGTALTPDQAKLMKKYADKVYICYDADGPGQNAANRAIDILKSVDMEIRILRIPGAKDPDEFIKDNGADAFRALLDQTEGDIVYRLANLRAKTNIATSEGKVKYLKQAASLLASIEEPIEREVYVRRVAQEMDISAASMFSQVDACLRQAKRKYSRELDRTVQAPKNLIQPASREIRYENIVSARAEEGVVAILFSETAFVKTARSLGLTGNRFSVPFLGRVFECICRREEEGNPVTFAAVAAELSADESSQLARILSNSLTTEPEHSLRDYISTINTENKKNSQSDNEAFAAILAKKGMGESHE